MSTAFVAIVTCVIFISGAVTGVIGLVSLAVHREERNHTLTGTPPGYMARAARRLNGVHVRIPGSRETTPAGRKWVPGGDWQFPMAAEPTHRTAASRTGGSCLVPPQGRPSDDSRGAAPGAHLPG
jgi:hypothetical protein